MCTPGEFSAVCKAYNETREADMRDAWNRMRLQACICIQPHVKKRLTPEALIPFSWERKRDDEAPMLSKENAKRRFEKLMRKGLTNQK